MYYTMYIYISVLHNVYIYICVLHNDLMVYIVLLNTCIRILLKVELDHRKHE